MTYWIPLYADDAPDDLIGWAAWSEFEESDDITRAPAAFSVFAGDEGGPELRLDFRVNGGDVSCVKLELRTTTDQNALRPRDLKDAIRVLSDWPDRVVDMVAYAHRNGVPGPDISRRRPFRRRKVTTKRLAEVADVYRRHLHSQPTAAVAEHFAITRPTAGRWVVSARRAGLLPPTTPGIKRA
jgi:hypothetical protein